jgi:hypothetical protein
MLRIPCGPLIRIVTGVETPIADREEGRPTAGVAEKANNPTAVSARTKIRKRIKDRTT